MIISETAEFRIGDHVWVYRDSSYGAVESAVVVDVRPDRSLRLEFTDGHRNHLRHGHIELRTPPAGAVAAGGRFEEPAQGGGEVPR
ncbi:hypothetical protein [Kitasatospora aureofaciens]|uniref:hypothetical protein n=1 Tax=Kitasatospora aureofaciens TaxID=1894 RepID=UPI001C4955A4|nr:hypothetical protein [Kitasatospora aureofaciens]MBV6701785.1 hypothetical protein [Kitasatospora aureofaciens]